MCNSPWNIDNDLEELEETASNHIINANNDVIQDYAITEDDRAKEVVNKYTSENIGSSDTNNETRKSDNTGGADTSDDDVICDSSVIIYDANSSLDEGDVKFDESVVTIKMAPSSLPRIQGKCSEYSII